MKKTETILLLLTVLNAGILGHFMYGKKQGARQPVVIQTPVAQPDDELARLREDFFFRAIPDENRPTGHAAKTPQLILRFSYRNCDLCIRSAMFELNKLKEQIGAETIRVLGSFANERDFEIFRQHNAQFELPFENVADDHFGMRLEQEAAYPFFFMLFPDGAVRHVFVPMKEDVLRSRRFLEILAQKYFQTDVASTAFEPKH